MKKTILFFTLIFSVFSFAQVKPESAVSEKKKYAEYVLLSDIATDSDGTSVIDKNITLKNGKKENVDVPLKVSFGKFEPTESDLKKININFDQTVWLAKFKLKNPVTYVPTSVKVTRNESSWKIVLWYYAKNNMGIEKEGMEIYNYDLTGAQIKK